MNWIYHFLFGGIEARAVARYKWRTRIVAYYDNQQLVNMPLGMLTAHQTMRSSGEHYGFTLEVHQ